MKPSLPNLIVIGAMKSGTTSLHDYLNQHPEIFMSQVKEIDYFVEERHWSDGLDWYQAQFDGASPIRGESSQNYSKRHHFESGVIRRIKETLGDTQFIYLVRDPIERIVSHYHEALEGGYAPKEGMNAFLAHDPPKNHYVLTSSYHYQLEPYVKHFGMERILVVTLEDLKSSRLETMNRIFRFLEVPEITNHALFDFVKNAGAEKRRKNLLGRLALGPGSAVLRSLLPRVIKDHMKSWNLTRKMVSTPVVREEIDSDLADQLREVLSPDMERLRALTGEPFAEWSV